MYAVWKYDTFPFVLTGKAIGEPTDDGFIAVEGYAPYKFKYDKLISDANGEKLKVKIEELREKKRKADMAMYEAGRKEVKAIIGD